jgi:ADP-ribose pyrophosphatase YjhB (NUDIX family)
MKVTESAGGLVLNPKGEVLVVSQNGNSWSLPKGHLDPGEDALQAARREIYEESGVRQLELVRELGTYERPRIGLKGGDDAAEVKRITLFYFRTRQTKLKPIDPKNPEARWVVKSRVAALLTHPLDRKFYLKAIQQIEKESAS